MEYAVPVGEGATPVPSARSVIDRPKTSSKIRTRRAGPISPAEKELVAQVVMDQPRELSPKQINGLANALRRPRELVKSLVEEAKENFVANAGRYVDLHMSGTEAAIANGDAKSLDAGLRAAAWALEHIGADGARVVEKATGEPQGPRIMVGIQLGGVDHPVTAIALPPAKEGEIV